MTNGTGSGTGPSPTAGVVAVVLAVGLATAVNLITVGVLYDAIFSEGPGLSSNATQILTTVFGGIVGILGSYIGYRAAAAGSQQPQEPAHVLEHPPQGQAGQETGQAGQPDQGH